MTPPSQLYRNDGNAIFTEVTATVAPDFKNLGMVTAAVWAHVVDKGTYSLVIAGDWMCPVSYEYKNGRFVKISTGLENHYGWWQSIAAADLDNDGIDELVLGNMGENGYLRPSQQTPVHLWMNDFDGNGTVDKVMTRTINQKETPVFLKAEMQEQMPLIKKQNLHYEEYAKKSFQELFSEDLRKKATVLQYNFCPSVIVWNLGQKNMRIDRLPEPVQFSCVNAICIDDIDADGNKDILMGGNQFGFLPQFGRLDGSYGSVLMNHGNKNFELLSDVQTGLGITGEIRNIGLFSDFGKKRFLFIRNNLSPVMIELQKQHLKNLHEKK